MTSIAYVLPRQELLKCQRALARNTPTKKAYQAYFATVTQYLALSKSEPQRIALHDGDIGTAITLRLHDSVLFRRKYLIGHVENGWFAESFPRYDAIASIVQNVSYDIPPLVLIPRKRTRSDSDEFLSVLEHELVHVNQAIRGTLPSREPKGELGAAIAAFFDVVRSEYDANLLQLARWPKFFPHESVPSLEFWCVLRGLTEALESAVTGAFCSPKLLPLLLTALPDLFDNEFRKCHIDGSLVPSFKRRFAHFASIAVSSQIKLQPALLQNASLRAALRCLRC